MRSALCRSKWFVKTDMLEQDKLCHTKMQEARINFFSSKINLNEKVITRKQQQRGDVILFSTIKQ